MTELIDDRWLSELAQAGHVLVLTGAGMSAESGISTFRDKRQGLWAKYRPEDLATPEAFAANPSHVWDWYQWRREKLRDVQPHAGYFALAEVETLLPDLHIVTQNVDGLHRASGSRQVIELHGNIRRSICSATKRLIDDDWITSHADSPPPSPHAKGAYARPDVVWFGESLPEDALNQAWRLARQADVILSVGTSALVQPAASLPIIGVQAGAVLIEINPEPTPLSAQAHHVLRASAGTALPAIARALAQGR